MQGVSWLCALILITLQKIGPLLLLSNTFLSQQISYQIVKLTSIISALVGSIGGLNQTLLRKVIAYSSINHLGWILAAIYQNKTIFSFYFITYLIVSSSIIITFIIYQINHYYQIYLINNNNMYLKTGIFCILFSLGGLPPFLGFIPKAIVTLKLLSLIEFSWLALIMITAIISLFYYIKLFIVGISPTSFSRNPLLLKKTNKTIFLLIRLNLIPLFNPILFIIPLRLKDKLNLSLWAHTPSMNYTFSFKIER